MMILLRNRARKNMMRVLPTFRKAFSCPNCLQDPLRPARNGAARFANKLRSSLASGRFDKSKERQASGQAAETQQLAKGYANLLNDYYSVSFNLICQELTTVGKI